MRSAKFMVATIILEWAVPVPAVTGGGGRRRESQVVNVPRQKPAAFKIVGMTSRAANTSSASPRAARAAAA